MLMIAFLRWWYGPGWHETINRMFARVHHTYLDFSVPILLRTLMAPWRRIVTSKENGSIGQKFRATIDNIVSRFVGLAVRLLALIAAGLIMLITLIAGGVIALLWPVLPLVGVILIVLGLAL